MYFRSLALRFNDFFTFNTVKRPGRKIMEKLLGKRQGPFSDPLFVVLAAEGYKFPKVEKEPKLTSLMYEEDTMGEMTYSRLMIFLLAVNRQYRITLPGNNLADDPDVLDMTEVFDIERMRFKLPHKDDTKMKKEIKRQAETEQLEKSGRDEL